MANVIETLKLINTIIVFDIKLPTTGIKTTINAIINIVNLRGRFTSKIGKIAYK